MKCLSCGKKLVAHQKKYCSTKCTGIGLTKKRDFENCLTCGKKLRGYWKKMYCNHRCAALKNNPKRAKLRYCKNCGKKLKTRQGLHCSTTCSWKSRMDSYIDKWLSGKENGSHRNGHYNNMVRRYLFEKNNNSCQIYGWGEINTFSNTIPLEMHHIDGNKKNNSPENLSLLCPNCHSLTNTYCGRNVKR